MPDHHQLALDDDRHGHVESLVRLAGGERHDSTTSPAPAASTCQTPVTSSAREPGTKTQRPTVPLFTVAGSRSANQTARLVSAPGSCGTSAGRRARTMGRSIE